MLLPIEILDIIVYNNLDSFKTLISWAHVSEHYRRIIQSQVGIICVHDGPGLNISNPLGYEVLFNDTNSISIDTEQFHKDQLAKFMLCQNNILICIHSHRAYSQPLRMVLVQIAHLCQIGINVCIIYQNTTNYLTRLYFNEFNRIASLIKLSELYIFGNKNIGQYSQLTDITSLFQVTYIYDITVLHSCVIKDTSHNLISQNVETINYLGYNVSDKDISSFLELCPNLKTISSFKFPAYEEDLSMYTLPQCCSISLTDFYTGVKYPTINGSNVTEELNLSLGICVTEPIFLNLYFSKITSLNLNLGQSLDQLVRFKSCNFKNLESINCDVGIIPWRDLIESGARIKHLKLKLYSFEQLRWLNECPFTIEKIEILSMKNTNPSNTLFSQSDSLLLGSKNLAIDADSLKHCNIIQNIFLPKLKEDSSLLINFNNQNLLQEISNSSTYHRYLELDYDSLSCLTFKIPYIHHLEIITQKGYGLTPIMDVGQSVSSISSNTPALYHFFNCMLGVQVRKDSMPETLVEEPRRHSNASMDSQSIFSDTEEIKYDGSSQDMITFELFENLPDILSLNLATFETTKFITDNIQPNILHLLKVIVDINENYISEAILILLIVKRIEDTIEYPYNFKFPNIILEKIQVVLKLTPSISSRIKDKQLFRHDIQHQLRLNNSHIKIVPPNIKPQLCRTASILY